MHLELIIPLKAAVFLLYMLLGTVFVTHLSLLLSSDMPMKCFIIFTVPDSLFGSR